MATLETRMTFTTSIRTSGKERAEQELISKIISKSNINTAKVLSTEQMQDKARSSRKSGQSLKLTKITNRRPPSTIHLAVLPSMECLEEDSDRAIIMLSGATLMRGSRMMRLRKNMLGNSITRRCTGKLSRVDTRNPTSTPSSKLDTR